MSFPIVIPCALKTPMLYSVLRSAHYTLPFHPIDTSGQCKRRTPCFSTTAVARHNAACHVWTRTVNWCLKPFDIRLSTSSPCCRARHQLGGAHSLSYPLTADNNVTGGGIKFRTFAGANFRGFVDFVDFADFGIRGDDYAYISWTPGLLRLARL